MVYALRDKKVVGGVFVRFRAPLHERMKMDGCSELLANNKPNPDFSRHDRSAILEV
jgi:hypothetical protein